MKKPPKPKSALEETFALQIRATRLPEPVREYKFDDQRRWRLDFAWPERNIGVELDGGIRPFYQVRNGKRVKVDRGRHVTPQGYEKDCEKHNACNESGIFVYRFTSAMVRDGRAIKLMERLLK